MSDKLIEAFLSMHNKPKLNNETIEEANVLKDKATMNPASMAARIRYKGALAAKKVEPVKPTGELKADNNYTLNKLKDKAETIARSALPVDLVPGLRNTERTDALRKFNPRQAETGDLLSIGSMLIPGRSAVSGASKVAGKVDDVAAKAKGIDGEILPKGTTAGDKAKDFTPSTSTAVAKTTKEVKPTGPSTGPSTALTRPNSSSVGPAMKTVDEVPPKLTGPAVARALPKPDDVSKALGGFSKVPMGKIAAGTAGTAALTLGSKEAGDKASATPPAQSKVMTPPDRPLGSNLKPAETKVATPPDRPLGSNTKAPEPAKPVEQEKYKIAKGDTLSDLAKKWNVSVGDIAKSNQDIKDVNKIQAGAELVKPQATNNPIYQGGIGTKAGPSKSQNIQKPKLKTETTEMTNKLIDSFLKLEALHSSNIFEAAKKIKKLDKVGKEDEDIDNDGDKDKSDKYLRNRREKIAKAMKEAKDPYAELDAPTSGGKAPATTTDPEWKKKMKPQEQTPTRNLKGSLPKGVTVKEEAEELDEAKSVFSPEKHEKFAGMDRKERGEYHENLVKMSRTHEEAGMREAAKKAAGEFRRKYMKPNLNEESDKDKAKKAFANLSAYMKRRAKVDSDASQHEKAAKKSKVADHYDRLTKEEVEFSEAELNHIANILEATPIAPVPDDYSGSKNGVSKRDLTDEKIIKNKKQ